MMHAMRRGWVAVCLGTLAAPSVACGQTVVALSGAASPGGGGIYASFPNGALLNGNGQVDFFAGLTGGSSTGGVFVTTAGSTQAAALIGAPAPAGGNYSAFYSDLNPNVTPVLAAGGRMAFNASLTGGTAASGLFAGTAGSLQAVALQGGLSPIGGTYNSFNAFNGPTLNNIGQVAFVAGVTGGTSNGGVFVGSAGSVQAVALRGAAAPGGGQYGGTFSSPVLNGVGQMAVYADFTVAGGPSKYAIYARAAGNVQVIARQGDVAPAGGTYSSFPFLSPSLNNAGQVALLAYLTGGTSTSGIFAGSAGSIQAVALQGSAAPNGGNYNGGFSYPLINSAGRVAIFAGLNGGTSTSGLFTGTAGNLETVALQGTLAPGGGSYSSFGTSGGDGSLTTFAINSLGHVAFTARLTGAGVTTNIDDDGLYVWASGGLTRVVREGDIVNVGTGGSTTNRTVANGGITFLCLSGGQDGQGVTFNDSDLLVYTLKFTDGSSAVVTYQFVPVPEPATVGLTAVAGLGLVRAVRRRRRRT